MATPTHLSPSKSQQPTATQHMANFGKRQNGAGVRECVITIPTWPPACEGCGDWARTVMIMTTINTLCTDNQIYPPMLAGPTPMQQPTLPSTSVIETSANVSKPDGGQVNQGLILGLSLGLGVPLMVVLLLAFGVVWIRRRPNHTGNARAVGNAPQPDGQNVPNTQHGAHNTGFGGGGGGGRGRLPGQHNEFNPAGMGGGFGLGGQNHGPPWGWPGGDNNLHGGRGRGRGRGQ